MILKDSSGEPKHGLMGAVATVKHPPRAGRPTVDPSCTLTTPDENASRPPRTVRHWNQRGVAEELRVPPQVSLPVTHGILERLAAVME
jgi:hypothetical protein